MNLVLSLTEQCNLRCTYCYYKVSHEERELVMSDEVLESAIKLAFNRTVELEQNFFNITFFGGEPLLRLGSMRKGVKIAKELVKARRKELPKDFRLQFALNTNGTLLNDDIVAFLKREKFQVYISLDGPERFHNIARKQVNGKGSFKLIQPHIQQLVDLDATVLSVVTPAHVKGLAKSVEWVFKQGFTQMTTAPDFDGNWTTEAFDSLALEYQKMALFWLKNFRQGKNFYLGTIYDKILLESLGFRKRELTCNIVKGGMSVSTNGNIFPCTRFISSKSDAKYILGNVLNQKPNLFNDTMSKHIYSYLKKDKPQCKGCAIRHRCVAHECACTAFYTTGSIEGISPEVCNHERILAAICDDTLAKISQSNNK
ncbi:MAG: radical SAM protein [Fibrobacter sp.]|nr:radical SAM protein [Fibrobacter sp.]